KICVQRTGTSNPDWPATTTACWKLSLCKISRSDTSSVLTKQFPSHRFLKMSRIIYNPLLNNGEVMRCFIRLLVSVNLIYPSSIECQSPMVTTIVYYVRKKSVIYQSSRFQGKESERNVIKLLA